MIGGGLIGLKAAEGLHLLGKKVTIVELADRILSAAFDRPAGRIVAKKMKANGIDVITDDTVVRVEGEGAEITGVTLKSGDFIPCDTVIVAIGVRPAAGFLKGSKVEVNRGIVVNDAWKHRQRDFCSRRRGGSARFLLRGRKTRCLSGPMRISRVTLPGPTWPAGRKDMLAVSP